MPRVQTTEQSDEDIFALDIGTRNVVGILGRTENGVFTVCDAVTVPHVHRAMMDGQIEDIEETARIVRIVKERLEEKTGITLKKVAIAAAGRALVTKRVTAYRETDSREQLTDSVLKSLELEAVSKAQSEIDRESGEKSLSFYCVGHSVIGYSLDDVPIKNLLGHKGKKASVELIAAFLPGLVAESLYTVMDMSGLEVISLTLEPIAAMNVIIPPEVRLINIALCDIGAGTSDIAVSREGSIVAYGMATVAGDEITEEIVRNYLVDFDTAERMKLTPPDEDVIFTDILGYERTLTGKEFFDSLSPAVEQLADTVAESIISANGTAPAAVFLVGGGSLIPGLQELVAKKLGIPETRAAIGGKRLGKNISSPFSGPEYVTPIGIGITATLQAGYDFSTITLNGERIRIFDTKSVTAAELLMNTGYKPYQIIGRSGRGLTFTLNGEKQFFRGEPSTPAQITINGTAAALDHKVRQGDVIDFIPAVSGANAAVTVSDIAGESFSHRLTVDGEVFTFGNTVRVNDTVVSGDYIIQNYDSVTIETIETLGDLILSLPFDTSGIIFYKNGRQLRSDYILMEHDDLITAEKKSETGENTPNRARDIALMSESAQNPDDVKTPQPTAPKGAISVYLNSRRITLEPHKDGSPNEFLELMALADIDTSDPPAGAEMILTINGVNAGFIDPLRDGDDVVIKWDTRNAKNR